MLTSCKLSSDRNGRGRHRSSRQQCHCVLYKFTCFCLL